MRGILGAISTVVERLTELKPALRLSEESLNLFEASLRLSGESLSLLREWLN
jgi:hypothetical protein